MQELMLSKSERLEYAAEAAGEAFYMDEETFRAFYDRTSRPLWCYLARVSGNPATADDLLQEAYYRFLRARLPDASEFYRKNYLFRIATNLLRDHWRQQKGGNFLPLDGPGVAALSGNDRTAENAQRSVDMSKLFERLKPRERQLLWLAYAEGSSHREIAERLSLKEKSIRLMLFRARRKLAGLLHNRRV